MSTTDPLLYAVDDGIATLTLNRPENMNTFSTPMVQRFVESIDVAEANDAVRVIIVTGAGERAFCAGADLGKGTDTFDYAKDAAVRDKLKVNGIYRDLGGWMSLRLFQCTKPVIAAVNGSAAGIGATLQGAMDIRIASKRAKFVFPFVRRGIAPEAASSWFLPRLVGLPTALEWCMTGRAILAEEAKERGFVQYLHEPEDVMPAARAIAREIAENTAPVSVAVTRQMLWRMAGASHPMEAHRADSRAVHYLGQAADAKEGITSFLEKRPPHFTGRVSEGLPDIFPGWIEPDFR